MNPHHAYGPGTILEGEVIITRGLHGTSRQVAVLGPGALISESALIDETAHSTGAFARHGAVVWQISTDKIAAFRKQKPENLLPHRGPHLAAHQ